MAEQHDDKAMATVFKAFPGLFRNYVRLTQFNEYQDILSRPGFKWKVLTYPEGADLVLTDHPVCQTSGHHPGGQVTIVPVSRRRVFFGGSQQAVNNCNFPVHELNAFLAGWAYRSVFAAERGALDEVVEILSGKYEMWRKEWCDRARLPCFGLEERSKTYSVSPDEITKDWWNGFKDSYGETILPWKRIRDNDD